MLLSRTISLYLKEIYNEKWYQKIIIYIIIIDESLFYSIQGFQQI